MFEISVFGILSSAGFPSSSGSAFVRYPVISSTLHRFSSDSCKVSAVSSSERFCRIVPPFRSVSNLTPRAASTPPAPSILRGGSVFAASLIINTLRFMSLDLFPSLCQNKITFHSEGRYIIWPLSKFQHRIMPSAAILPVSVIA